MKVAIIGLGNMGEAIASRLEDAEDISLTRITKEDDVNALLKEQDVVIVAVKPQSFDVLAQSITANLSDVLVISIMAGVTIAELQEKLGAQKVVRSMPNLGASLGESATGWVSSDACLEEDEKVVEQVLFHLGPQFGFDDESFLDAFTVICGSGPAFFFFLAQLLSEKAQEFGFTHQQATNMARQTFFGSAHVMHQSEREPGEWVEKVSSKGGVTEQAITYMKEHGFDTIFTDALQKAKEKSEELGK